MTFAARYHLIGSAFHVHCPPVRFIRTRIRRLALEEHLWQHSIKRQRTAYPPFAECETEHSRVRFCSTHRLSNGNIRGAKTFAWHGTKASSVVATLDVSAASDGAFPVCEYRL
jgi:hypothetical protein